MPDRPSLARWFLLGGGVLIAVGLLLAWVLPIALPFPPYLLTGGLAVAYGLVSRPKNRPATAGKDEPRG